MTKEDVLRIIELIDACRGRGVTSLKFDGVEFTLAPQLPASDPLDVSVSKPLDTSKCLQCQQREPKGRIAGLCRECSLGAAGVAS